MISIIIPCYNGYQYMHKCLEALEKQTYKDFEIVICDDCSTDDSYECLLEYRRKSKMKMTVVRNSINAGPGESRNHALSFAQGEWFMFCDCDDWYEINAVEKMMLIATSKEAELVMCDNYYVDANGNKQKRNSTKELVDCTDKKKQLAYSRMSLCRLIVKKVLFTDLKIPAIYNGEDGAVVPVLLARSRKNIFIDDCLYNYYIHIGTGSTIPNIRVYKGLIDSFFFVRNSLERDYAEECEFIGIKVILYGAVFNAIKAKITKINILEVINEYGELYPQWYDNKYINSLSKSKRMFLFCVKNKCFFPLRIYTFVHILFERKMSK